MSNIDDADAQDSVLEGPTQDETNATAAGDTESLGADRFTDELSEGESDAEDLPGGDGGTR